MTANKKVASIWSIRTQFSGFIYTSGIQAHVDDRSTTNTLWTPQQDGA